MLTEKQKKLIERRVKKSRDAHISSLHAVSNDVLKELTPANVPRYGGVLEQFVSGTVTAVKEWGDTLIKDVTETAIALKAEVSPEDADAILRICKRYVQADIYEERLASFKASFERHMRGYGMSVSLERYRFDLIEARYRAGVANTSKRILSDLQDAIDLVAYADSPTADLPTSKVHKKRSVLNTVNELFELKPNIAGFGINLNNLIGWWIRRRK